MTSTDAPPIETATDPVHSPDDLRQRWLALMSPLGFGDRTLWMAFLGADRRMEKVLTPLPARTARDRERAAEVIAELPAAVGDWINAGATVAFLLTRPGRDGISDDDRDWAARVSNAAAAHRVPLEAFHRANDVALLRVPPSR